MFIGILFYSILITAISLVIIRKYAKIERAEMMTYLILSSWGSLLYGIFITRISY
ncbi:MAG: hypothetical protein WA610_06600 [Thermodesulfovibrionales bacterium]